MKYIQLAMLRDHMRAIPAFDCPPGYRIRTYVPGDEYNWARIETLAGEFRSQEAALQRFQQFYGPSLEKLADRGFFLENSQGEAIGTATAWFGEFAGAERGRVSWVAIIPAEQGKKLAKPLLSAVLQRLAQEHSSAFLTTQTTSYPAINLYLSLGFAPYLLRDTCPEGWSLMEQTLQRKIL